MVTKRAVLFALLLALLLAVPALGEVIQRGGVRVSVSGHLAPRRLPRHRVVPVAVTIGGRIAPAEGGVLPQLRRLAIAINGHGLLDRVGLPLCRRVDIQPASTRDARLSCGPALIGTGSFSSDVRLPDQSPFPSRGRVLAFNGRYRGHPAILAHIYGTVPTPTSYVLPFLIQRGHGAYGTLLTASLPDVTGDWGFVTGLRLTLSRRFRYRGRPRSYLSASCPAPSGVSIAPFPLARTTFAFAGGLRLTQALSRSCTVRP
jgi:hypothetical protein